MCELAARTLLILLDMAFLSRTNHELTLIHHQVVLVLLLFIHFFCQHKVLLHFLVEKTNESGIVLLLMLQCGWTDVIVMLVVRVTRKEHPGGVHEDVAHQVDLSLILTCVHSVQSDDVSNPEDVGEVTHVLGKKLHRNVSHGLS